jgi:hypothetical protein
LRGLAKAIRLKGSDKNRANEYKNKQREQKIEAKRGCHGASPELAARLLRGGSRGGTRGKDFGLFAAIAAGLSTGSRTSSMQRVYMGSSQRFRQLYL